jgi:hypothetical protein
MSLLLGEDKVLGDAQKARVLGPASLVNGVAARPHAHRSMSLSLRRG